MKGIAPNGNYLDHLLSGWKLKEHPNVKWICYEDLKSDLAGAIENAANFLELPIIKERAKILADNLSFDKMKRKQMSTPTAGINVPDGQLHFMRKGIVGDWKNHFDEEMMAEWNAWIRSHVAGTGMEDLDMFKHLFA